MLWTRSAFFWAFLAVAIASFGGAVHAEHRTLALLVACFAAVCSLCWTLANRAGKYWQEIWEKNVEDVEQSALGEGIFSRKIKIPESWFWGAKRYSPSRLTMAVSDLTLALWSILAVGTALVDVPHPITLLRIALLMLTLIYAAGILVWCKSEAQQPLNIKDAWTQFSEAIFKWKAAVKLIFRSGDTPDAPCSSARPPVLVLRLRLGSARPILRRPKASDDEGDGMLTRIDRAILRGADAARLAAALIPGSLLLLTSP